MKILHNTASFKSRTIANYLGNLVSILSSVIFFPLYLKYYGVNQFSLITFASSVLALILLFDFGFGAVLRREFAIDVDDLELDVDRNKFLISIERLYAICFFVFILLMLFLHSEIKKIFSQFSSIPNIELIVGLMCTMSFFQLYSNLYNSVLGALNKHVVLNIIQTIMLIIRNGLVLVISIYSNSLLYFFLFQAAIMLIHVSMLRWIVYFVTIRKTIIPAENSFLEDLHKIKNHFKLGLSFFTLSLLSTLNFQLDKLFIVRNMSSADLGSYNTAMVLSQAVVNLAAPIIGTLSPLIISLHSSKSYLEIDRMVSKYTLIFNLITGTILALFVFHANFLIGLWIGENEIKNSILNIILFLLGSSALILNQMLPYQVSIASLNFKKVVIFGFLNIIITIPLYYFGVKYGGIKGVAMVWFFSNLYLTIINNYLYLSPIYIELYKKMLFRLTLLPILASFILFAFFEQFKPDFSNQYLQFFAISIVAMLGLFVSASLFRKKIIINI